MNKQPGSTLSKTVIGSRSCYITVKRLCCCLFNTCLTLVCKVKYFLVEMANLATVKFVNFLKKKMIAR